MDLFCGAGGLSYGFQQAGFELLAAADIDPERVAAFDRNIAPGRVHQLDLRQTTGEQLIQLAGAKPDLIIGGPPCQPYAFSGHRRGQEDNRDGLADFIRLVVEIQPRFVVMENVPGYWHERFRAAREEANRQLQEAGYFVEHGFLNAMDFGLAQNRRRGFLVAVRGGLEPWPWPRPLGGRPSAQEQLADLLASLPEHPLPPWLAKKPIPPEGNLMLSGKNANKWGNQWIDLDGPIFTLTASAKGRHRIRYNGRWLRFTRECFQRLQGFPDHFGGLAEDALGDAVPPPVARAIAQALKQAIAAGFPRLTLEVR